MLNTIEEITEMTGPSSMLRGANPGGAIAMTEYYHPRMWVSMHLLTFGQKIGQDLVKTDGSLYIE
jgi:hypothetical protein